jgi:hypothetical protein
MNNNFVIFTHISDNNYLNSFLEIGIAGIIYKTAKLQTMIKQFCFMLKSISFFKRKYVRVKPAQQEVALIKMYIPEIKYNIIGIIRDISINGFAFKVKNQTLPDVINNKIIKNLNIILNDNNLIINGKINIRNNLGIVVFHELSKEAKLIISKYVAKKIVSVKTKKLVI